jgi:hypothetical protein
LKRFSFTLTFNSCVVISLEWRWRPKIILLRLALFQTTVVSALDTCSPETWLKTPFERQYACLLRIGELQIDPNLPARGFWAIQQHPKEVEKAGS